MERAANLLGATLRRMKNPEAAQAWLKARWTALVGETLATHIQPALAANRILNLQADSREWIREAEAMRDQLREKVNRDWGGALVQEVRVQAQAGARIRREFDNDHLPFLRKRTGPKT